MNDRQKFAAAVQAFMALLLIGAVALIALILLGIVFYQIVQRLGLDQTITSLLNTIVNALINMGAIGVGFWLARHRPQQADGSDDSPEKVPPVPAAPAAQVPNEQPVAPAGAQR